MEHPVSSPFDVQGEYESADFVEPALQKAVCQQITLQLRIEGCDFESLRPEGGKHHFSVFTYVTELLRYCAPKSEVYL